MTYCVAMSLDAGMIFASDSRTNAGVDQISRFSKMRVFVRDGDRVIVMLSSGNLSITQNAINMLEQRARAGDDALSLWNAPSMFDVARLLGDALREVKTRDGPYLVQNNIDSSANFLVGGQIRGEPPRLFNVYSEGNFIEATAETCYFQIGETKYGKPIIDRVVTRDRRWSTRPSARWSRSTRRCARTSRSACRSTSWSTRPTRWPCACSGASRRPTPTSRWCTRSGARACGACSRSCPTPTGSERRAPATSGNLMAIRVALQHRTTYRFDRRVAVSPHEIRLRPAPHCRTPILGYSLNVAPAEHFLNWQQDPYGNWVARAVFPEAADRLEIVVDLTADMTVINPFDFFVEPYAETYPFPYAPALAKELIPFLETAPLGPRLAALVERFRATIAPGENTVDMLVRLNRDLQHEIRYLVRMEPGVQTPEETLERAAAPAATPAGCWCRSCATWGSPRASPRAT